MSRGTVLILAAMAAVFLAVSFMKGGDRGDDGAVRPAPWNIFVNEDGTSEVFGIVLGRTTASSAMITLNMEPEISLFESSSGRASVEAYFGKVTIGGLSGKLVANLEAPVGWVEEAKKRAVKTEPATGRGERKIVLSSEDYRSAMLARVIALTYVPSVNIDEKVIRGRFGQPDSIMRADENVSYWSYPSKGLLIIVNKKGKEILQYMRPPDFDVMTSPLLHPNSRG